MASQHKGPVMSTFEFLKKKSKKTSKLRVTGLCAGNSPATSEFSAQMASITEKVSIWWCHHDVAQSHLNIIFIDTNITQGLQVDKIFASVSLITCHENYLYVPSLWRNGTPHEIRNHVYGKRKDNFIALKIAWNIFHNSAFYHFNNFVLLYCEELEYPLWKKWFIFLIPYVMPWRNKTKILCLQEEVNDTNLLPQRYHWAQVLQSGDILWGLKLDT